MIIALRKKMKLIFIILLLGIIPAFTIFGVGSILKSPKRKTMGEINGRKVGMREYNAAYMEIYRDSQLSSREMPREQLNEAAWLRLILLDEAKKYGLQVSNEQVAHRVASIFKREGKFDKRFYYDILNRSFRITPAVYEEQTRKTIAIDTLRDIILGGIKITENELYQQYLNDNQKLTVNYLLFPYRDYLPTITPTEEELLAYYEENKDTYKKPNEVNTKYVSTSVEDYLTKFEASEEEAESYFEENKQDFMQAHEVHARHILFKIDENADEDAVEKVKTTAQGILEKANDGEDFAELAKEHSQGPSASNGGDLGFFGKGAMVPPFEEAAFTLKAGEVFPELVRTKFGYHIIKAEEIKEEIQKNFDDVKEEVITKIKTEKADALARELIEECYYKSEDLESMKEVADELGIKVEETGFFSYSYDIPEIGNSREYYEQAFELDLFKTSEIINTNNKYYLFSPVDHRNGSIPELSEIRTRLKNDYKREKSKELAEADAKKALDIITPDMGKQNKSFTDVAKSAGYKPIESKPFSKQSPDVEMGYGVSLAETLFSTKTSAVSDPIETTTGFLIAEAKAYEQPDLTGFEETKETLRVQQAMQKKYIIFQEWLTNVKQNAKLVDLTKYVNQSK